MRPIGNHRRVSEYDGAFRCYDCDKLWGAVTGHPPMPEICERIERRKGKDRRQSLSQEAVRDETIADAARYRWLQRHCHRMEEFAHMEMTDWNAEIDSALKREPNAAAESYEAVHPKALDEPAPAAPDVADMVKRAIKEMRFFQSVRSRVPADAQYDEWIALLAKLGQDWVTEPVAWRREWDGDISDVGHMIYVDDPHDRDEPLSRWQPLYAKEPGASDE